MKALNSEDESSRWFFLPSSPFRSNEMEALIVIVSGVWLHEVIYLEKVTSNPWSIERTQ